MKAKDLIDSLATALEEAQFGFFAEEFLIRAEDSRAAYFYLCSQLKKLSELLQMFPQKADQLKEEFAKTKKKIVLDLLKKSLLLSENDSDSKTLSGDPFTYFKQLNQ